VEPDSNGWLQEAGEAIGNVGKKVFRRRSRRREAEEALERWLKLIPAPVIPPTQGEPSSADTNVIDTTWRVIDNDEEEQDE